MFFARGEISFPDELAQALKPPPGRAGSLQALWEKLAKRRGMVAEGERHYSFSRPEAESYSAYYLPANALKTALVAEEAFLLGLDLLGREAHWLDLGTGPGTAYWGLAWWAAARGKQFRFTGWDQSPVFAEIASRLAGQAPFGSRAQFSSGKEEMLGLVRRMAPTHVSFVNSVAEIYPDPARRLEACRGILRALADSSRRDGRERYLLIVEPGSRESSRELSALKDALAGDGQVLLPCLDSRPCGALVKPTDWCHEEVACDFPPWLNELGAEAGLRKESILFSYALVRAGKGSEFSRAGRWRVVSQRLERKGQVECWACTPTGKLFARAQRSKGGSALVAEAVRGDLWAGVELAEKGDVLAGTREIAEENSVFAPKAR